MIEGPGPCPKGPRGPKGPPSNGELTPYDRGWNAAWEAQCKGVSEVHAQQACPYPVGTEEAFAWFRGFAGNSEEGDSSPKAAKAPKEREQILLPFEIACGTVTGRDHISMGRGSQDGFCVLRSLGVANEEVVVAIACDGCGSGEHSEVGAKIGTKMLVKTIFSEIASIELMRLDPSLAEKYLQEMILSGMLPSGNPFGSYHHVFPKNFQEVLEMSRESVSEKIRTLSKDMGLTTTPEGRRSQTETVRQYLLFTAIGFVMTTTRTVAFSLGDGVACMNGETFVLDPGEGNEPEYLAYGFVSSGRPEPKFRILWEVPTDQVQSVLVGTDGTNLILKSSDNKMPGKDEKVGGLDQFWTNDFFFKNPDGLRRRLALMNRTAKGGDGSVEHGILLDDTTIIVARRRA